VFSPLLGAGLLGSWAVAVLQAWQQLEGLKSPE